VISSSQRPLPDNTQHSQQTDIHARGGIRTHDLSRRAAATTGTGLQRKGRRCIEATSCSCHAAYLATCKYLWRICWYV